MLRDFLATSTRSADGDGNGNDRTRLDRAERWRPPRSHPPVLTRDGGTTHRRWVLAAGAGFAAAGTLGRGQSDLRARGAVLPKSCRSAEDSGVASLWEVRWAFQMSADFRLETIPTSPKPVSGPLPVPANTPGSMSVIGIFQQLSSTIIRSRPALKIVVGFLA